MALNFNPFEKDKPAPTPKTKDKHSHYRVFDDPTQQNISSSPSQESSSTNPALVETLEHAQKLVSKTDYKEATNGSQTDYK